LRPDPQNYAKHIFDKIPVSPKTFVPTYPSTNLIIPSGPKLFLILFVRYFGEKARTPWGHISQKSSSGIFWAGWLVG